MLSAMRAAEEGSVMSAPDVTAWMGGIYVDGKFKGSGFRVGANLILTANHVVESTVSVEFRPINGPTESAHLTDSDEVRDVAILQTAAATISSPLLWAPAAPDDRWEVLTQPSANDPQLSGHVVTPERGMQNARMNFVTAMQLETSTQVGSYRGYSGSPVVAAANPAHVLGVLVEQGEWRSPVSFGQAMGATNVLYAVPVLSVIQRFDLQLSLPRADSEDLLPQGLLNWERQFSKVLSAEQLATRGHSSTEHERLEVTRRGLSLVLDILASQSPRDIDRKAADAERDLRSNVGLQPKGKTAGVANGRLLAACYLGLHIIAGVQGDITNSERHRLQCYLYAPYSSRTQYFSEHFRYVLAPLCADLYDKFEAETANFETRASFRFARGAVPVAGAAIAVGGLVAAFTPATRYVGAPAMAVGVNIIRASNDSEFLSDYEKDRLRGKYRGLVDKRCQALARAALESGDQSVLRHDSSPTAHAISDDLLNIV